MRRRGQNTCTKRSTAITSVAGPVGPGHAALHCYPQVRHTYRLNPSPTLRSMLLPSFLTFAMTLRAIFLRAFAPANLLRRWFSRTALSRTVWAAAPPLITCHARCRCSLCFVRSPFYAVVSHKHAAVSACANDAMPYE